MSKKNEKRKRSLEREKAHAKETYIAIVVALFFLVMGVAGLINNSNYLKEYNNSEDIRQIEAVVTDATLENDNADGRLWFVHLKYDVDGTEYNDTATTGKYDVSIGDTIKVEVYKRPNGEYAVPEITDSWSLAMKNVLNYISLAVGVVLMAASISYLVTTMKKIKQLQAKIQMGGTGNSV